MARKRGSRRRMKKEKYNFERHTGYSKPNWNEPKKED